MYICVPNHRDLFFSIFFLSLRSQAFWMFAHQLYTPMAGTIALFERRMETGVPE